MLEQKLLKLALALICIGLMHARHRIQPADDGIPFFECIRYLNVADGLGDYEICSKITYYEVN